MKTFKFNLYDNQWNFVREVWSAMDHGLKTQGDYKKSGHGYLKRMN